MVEEGRAADHGPGAVGTGAAVPPVSIAVRVYPVLPDTPRRPRSSRRPPPRPGGWLVFDTETRVDVTQRLTFGSCRFLEDGRCLRESLLVADDASASERDVLTRYASAHLADVGMDGRPQLELLSRGEFLARFFQLAYKARVLVVGFNLPFDLSRLAYQVTTARKGFAGGFSLRLWSYPGQGTRHRRNRYRPDIGVKHIDSKRALIGFTKRLDPDREDLIPEDSVTGDPDKSYIFRGHFLDLRTLAFALTDRGHSLESACQAFGVEHPKQPTARHGLVTPGYIDYNRRDVLATGELGAKLLEEYDRHPIDLQVTKAFSPASIGKAYLRAMGIPPVLERQPTFPPAVLGYAQTAFFGGRASAHIRKVAVPVVYVDFLSMYPTVNSLMGLWRFVIAKRIRVVRNCTGEIKRLLRDCAQNPGAWFDPSRWPQLAAFVRVAPNGDVLPMRGKFSVAGHDWQVAVNHVYAGEAPNDAVWYALPDVVASVMLTGRVPTITEAIRLEPTGRLSSLTATRLRGTVDADPATQDVFRLVVEERKRLASRSDLPKVERDRLDKALKVLANATSYGIYAEMHREERNRPTIVEVRGIDPEPSARRVAHPDAPGEYCFPPLASLITAAARLMLALLEHCVTTQGGTYAMEDTDSMAIVATRRGGIVPCAGGSQRTADGRAGVRALSWADVDAIADRFRTLNPYDRRAVPGSVLEIEKDNFDPETKAQRQLWCVAISAKRYVLFLRDAAGAPVLLRKGINNHEDRWSEHGLGHLVNPTNPDSDDRQWISRVWLNIARGALGLPRHPLRFSGLPAVGRLTITSPALLRPFAGLNKRKPFRQSVKPFNFLSTCHVRAFGHPTGISPERFQLVAPYEPDPRRWLGMPWLDRYSAQTYRITTTGHHGTRRAARVQTYGDVIEAYEHHPEAKCAGADGRPCDRQTVGLLQRRHVRMESIAYIGKESNSLEEVQAGLIHDEKNVYTDYTDPRRGYWDRVVVPALRKLPLNVWERETGKGRRILIDARRGRRRPQRKHQELLTAIVRQFGLLP